MVGLPSLEIILGRLLFFLGNNLGRFSILKYIYEQEKWLVICKYNPIIYLNKSVLFILISHVYRSAGRNSLKGSPVSLKLGIKYSKINPQNKFIRKNFLISGRISNRFKISRNFITRINTFCRTCIDFH